MATHSDGAVRAPSGVRKIALSGASIDLDRFPPLRRGEENPFEVLGLSRDALAALSTEQAVKLAETMFRLLVRYLHPDSHQELGDQNPAQIKARRDRALKYKAVVAAWTALSSDPVAAERFKAHYRRVPDRKIYDDAAARLGGFRQEFEDASKARRELWLRAATDPQSVFIVRRAKIAVIPLDLALMRAEDKQWLGEPSIGMTRSVLAERKAGKLLIEEGPTQSTQIVGTLPLLGALATKVGLSHALLQCGLKRPAMTRLLTDQRSTNENVDLSSPGASLPPYTPFRLDYVTKAELADFPVAIDARLIPSSDTEVRLLVCKVNASNGADSTTNSSSSNVGWYRIEGVLHSIFNQKS